MTRIPKTSPTQIRLFARCPRAYWYTYPNGERQPPGPGAELGTRLHNEFEKWLASRDFPDVDPRVDAALKLLHPHELNCATLESWVTLGNVRGRVDLLVVDGDSATVLDLKTTSNAKYALTPSELATDIQMVCYGLAVAHAHPDVRYLTLVHLYTLTKGQPRAWRSATSVHVDVLRRYYDEHIAPLVDGARLLWHETEPPPALEGAPHTPACNAYGGCPFRSRCGERFPIPEQDPMVGLVEALYHKLTDENRAEFESMCEHVDFAAWQSEDLAGAHSVLTAMVATQTPTSVGIPAAVVNSALAAAGPVTTPPVTEFDAERSVLRVLQPILPPDATPNAALDPLDVPLTEVDGVGKTLADRWANGGVATVRAYVDALPDRGVEFGDSDFLTVKGWTARQHEAVLAYAEERDRPAPEPVVTPSQVERLKWELTQARAAVDSALAFLEETFK